MLQLNPHLPGWNTDFSDLIRILKTVKKDGRKKGSEGRERNGEKAEETEMCGSVVTN